MKRAMAVLCVAHLWCGTASAQECQTIDNPNITWPDLHKCLVRMNRQIEEFRQIFSNLTDARFSYSVQFKGQEFSRQIRPVSRIWFHATDEHDVKMSLFMTRDARSATAQFALQLLVNANELGTVFDSRDMISIPSRLLFHQSGEIQDLRRPPPGLHYIQFEPTPGRFSIGPDDFFEASGIIYVVRKSR